MASTHLLLIEDDAAAGAALQKVLRGEGYRVTLVPRGDSGLSRAQEETFDLVLTDLRLPGLNGLELVARLRALQPRLPVILMTAHGTTETAIEATKLGACEYLTKPCDADELLSRIAVAVSHSRRDAEPVLPAEAVLPAPSSLVGQSRAMQEVYKEIGRVAAAPVSVLIRGATGTGKELVARALHAHSDRPHGPFIAVNCAAIPPALLESELFGHERGSFTGAESRRIGRFEQALGGTLFLDEVGDLSIDTQAKLLRVLQEKVLRRVGGDALIPVDVRIVAATHRDLEEAINEREFRSDLYFRLSVVTLTLPALSARTEDIPDLTRHFIRTYATELGVAHPSVTAEALAVLRSEPWPGNVRQLENVVRQALLRARPFAVGPEHVREALHRSRQGPAPGRGTVSDYLADLLDRASRGEVVDAHWQMIADMEAELFAQAIRLAGGNQAKAARWLGVSRLKLREKLLELGLHHRSRDGEINGG